MAQGLSPLPLLLDYPGKHRLRVSVPEWHSSASRNGTRSDVVSRVLFLRAGVPERKSCPSDCDPGALLAVRPGTVGASEAATVYLGGVQGALGAILGCDFYTGKLPRVLGSGRGSDVLPVAPLSDLLAADHGGDPASAQIQKQAYHHARQEVCAAAAL